MGLALALDILPYRSTNNRSIFQGAAQTAMGAYYAASGILSLLRNDYKTDMGMLQIGGMQIL